MLAALLGASVSLCVYVASNFKTGNFTFVWPIKVRSTFASAAHLALTDRGPGAALRRALYALRGDA